MNCKQNITNLPTYNDGFLRLYEIKQKDNKFPFEYISDLKIGMYFEEISISDKLRFDAEQREKRLTVKIRVPQTKQITSLNVLKIGNEYHKVYNVYHFTNKDEIKQTDITLEKYPNPRLEESL